jgi:putative lipase involved disintegration of autophagic bodies
LRSNAKIYVHGHSAGGTNPSLVEAMSFGLPVLAFDCEFNRATTKNKALYFSDSKELFKLLSSDANVLQSIGSNMLDIANSNYTWSSVGDAYFELFGTKCVI